MVVQVTRSVSGQHIRECRNQNKKRLLPVDQAQESITSSLFASHGCQYSIDLLMYFFDGSEARTNQTSDPRS